MVLNPKTNSTSPQMTNFRWVICAMMFFATMVNYMDRQVLSLTWKDFISPEFHWSDGDYGMIAALFGIIYAIANLFSGRFIDFMGTKKGYLIAIGVWSLGACLHAACGWATELCLNLGGMRDMLTATGTLAETISITSVYFFIAARTVLAVGESGNFPAAVKVTAEYFPKRDRAFATSVFNAGSTVGSLFAPLTIPSLARYFKNIGVGNGWEMSFLVIGALGFIWMGFWVFLYQKPAQNKRVNSAELAYIEQDSKDAGDDSGSKQERKKGLGFFECFCYRQTWAIFLGKLFTDGAWWFFLFWTPAYLSDVYGFSSDSTMAQVLMFTLYGLTLLSLLGGKLPTLIINRTGLNPYAARMRAMLLFALIPLLILFAQPLGKYSYWFPVVIIGVACAAHQSWSANLYSIIGDMFPKSTIATLTGINGMAGGISSFCINIGSGRLFDYSAQVDLHFMGFAGKPAGYFIVFCLCAVSYMLGWIIIKLFVPKYKPINLN